MLPKKAVIAILVGSLLYFGYEGMKGRKMTQSPNLLLGTAIVGAYSFVQSIKELTQVV